MRQIKRVVYSGKTFENMRILVFPIFFKVQYSHVLLGNAFNLFKGASKIINIIWI